MVRVAEGDDRGKVLQVGEKIPGVRNRMTLSTSFASLAREE